MADYLQNMPKNGDILHITYTCKDLDGNVLEALQEPAEITLGQQDVLPALEKQLAKMSLGETRTVTLKPTQAFGPIYDDLFLEVPMDMLEQEEPQLGETVEVDEEGEEPCPGTIVEIYEDSVLVDCNHPMAGKTLVFELTLCPPLQTASN